MSKKKNFSRFFLFVIVLIFDLVCFVPVIIWIDNINKFPDVRGVIKYNSPNSHFFTDKNGIFLRTSTPYRKLFFNYEEIPPLIIQTLVAMEDKNFFKHKGIDFLGIVRSSVLLLFNLLNKNRKVPGASTITQQLVRNILLSSHYSFLRKMREIILAIRIERHMSKKEIITMYLNEIYFGSSNIGIKSAARDFFNKELQYLDYNEVAFLIGIIQNPSYCLVHNNHIALKRRNLVLKVMVDHNLISNEQYLESISLPIRYYKRHDLNTIHGFHFLISAQSEMNQCIDKNVSQSQNLTVQTTMNLEIQKIAEQKLLEVAEEIDNKRNLWHGTLCKASIKKNDIIQDKVFNIFANFFSYYQHYKNIKKNIYLAGLISEKKYICLLDNKKTVQLANSPHLKELKKGHIFLVEKKIDNTYHLYQVPEVNGSVIVVDTKNGNVLAMVGSSSIVHSNFNRATMTKFGMSSIFKGFILMHAFTNGLDPSFLVDDYPIQVIMPGSQKPWEPRNHDDSYWGTITMRRAFEFSRNLGLIDLVLHHTGLNDFFDFCVEKGIIRKNTPRVPAMLLGCYEYSLVEMAKVLMPLSNGGYSYDLKFIRSIENKKTGEELYLSPQQNKPKLYSDEVLYLTYSCFNGATERSVLKKFQAVNSNLAAKSGTANNFRNGVFLVYCDGYLFLSNVALDSSELDGPHGYGASSAGEVLKRILLEVDRRKLLPLNPIPNCDTLHKVVVDYNNGKVLPKTTKPDRSSIINEYMWHDPYENNNENKTGKENIGKENKNGKPNDNNNVNKDDKKNKT